MTTVMEKQTSETQRLIRPLRVTIINQHVADVMGGSEIQCDLIANGLAQRGHEVTYVAPTTRMEISINAPYTVVSTSFDPADIAETILSSRPDIVYWRFNKRSFRFVARRLHQARIPIVFAVAHINDLTPWQWHIPGRSVKKKIRQIIRQRWEYSGFSYVDAITVPNDNFLGRSTVAREYFVPNGMRKQAVAFEWPRPYCAWIANIKARKRPEAFVQLARELEPSGIDCLMVGYLQSQDYRWIQKPENLPANCHYLGPKSLEEVNGLLAASRFHVHTCQPEGFSNVFIQAWLHGRPSISLGFDPCDYISEQALGFVANNDFSVFTDQARYLADHPKECDRLGARARDFAEKTFRIEALVYRIETILQETIDARDTMNISS